jgi:hypothetical protein
MLDMKDSLDELDRKLCDLGLQQCADWPDESEIPHPTKFRPRVPRTYWAVFGAMLALTLWMLLLLTNTVRLNWDLRLQFIGFTSMLVVIVIGAVVGAFFFGMFLGHRIITRGSFTPFETSMMEMKERLSRMEGHIEHLNPDAEQDGEDAKGSSGSPGGGDDKTATGAATRKRRQNVKPGD